MQCHLVDFVSSVFLPLFHKDGSTVCTLKVSELDSPKSELISSSMRWSNEESEA